MSKWGRVSESDAKRKFEADPKEAAKMVSEMATKIIEQDQEISDLKNKLLEESLRAGGALQKMERLMGYQERVRELDPPKIRKVERQPFQIVED
ncbi:MAG: hypothetical protein ACPG4X_14775 [Pikeienuella sp.]